MSVKTSKIIIISTYTVCGAAIGYAHFLNKKLDRDLAALKQNIAMNDQIMQNLYGKTVR